MQAVFNKKKIFNDPIYGFITIPNDLVFDLVEHPFFQRLRRIKQLGLTSYVYPGALHTRFHHALGAMHLMTRAIETLRSKGHEITDEEAEAVTIAILLHDIGHGPFSHALEHTLVKDVTHEQLSLLFMQKLNEHFEGKLSLAIEIFQDQYHKRFLHQMVSSQLDMDRLDYLQRDSFYSGVSEGVIGTERIISMLNVKDDSLVVDYKGIYSVEKFLIARRLMYWQVYLHKTVISAEFLLVKLLERAKYLANEGHELFCTRYLHRFLYSEIGMEDFVKDPSALENFAHLDDYDILTAAKEWVHADDRVLSYLSEAVVDRKLLKVDVSNSPFEKERAEELKASMLAQGVWSKEELDFLIFEVELENNAYNPITDRINLLYKDNSTRDIADAADHLNISALSESVARYYLMFPAQIAVDK